MTLRLFNSLTREKQDFIPRTAGMVRMYVCGMTVYDFCHIGHARVLVVFDLVAKWLRESGFQLTYVRNITDVDDKILRQAALNNETPCQLTHRFIRAMHEDCEALGVAPPDHEPRATEHVEAMVRMIRTLEKKGMAYQGADGDVYYSVRLFPAYGRLSGKSLDQLRAGERVQVAADKKDPLDFVLWKKAKEGEMRWPSPWGPGRPGWHIECSAMSSELLGEHFDIHGGGQDLKFPHHENEIAQSDGTFGHDCVNYWLHNGFVQVDGNKMSKSLGNFFTIREVLQRYPAEVLRYFILRTHYRSPLSFSDAHLNEAQQGLRKLYTSLSQYPAATTAVDWTLPAAQKFREALNDDFNTPDAMVVLFELAAHANQGDAQAAVQLRTLGQLLGLLGQEPREFLQLGATLSPEEIERQINERRTARAARDFKLADDIRQRLLNQGIVVEDNAQGTLWRRL